MAPVLQKCINNPFLGNSLTELVQACLFSSGFVHILFVCCGIAITQNALTNGLIDLTIGLYLSDNSL